MHTLATGIRVHFPLNKIELCTLQDILIASHRFQGELVVEFTESVAGRDLSFKKFSGSLCRTKITAIAKGASWGCITDSGLDHRLSCGQQ